jgi:hypothetical protein
MSSQGAKSVPSLVEPKGVEGWEHHTYLARNGGPERYTCIGKEVSSDGATLAFLDYGNKATRAAADVRRARDFCSSPQEEVTL